MCGTTVHVSVRCCLHARAACCRRSTRKSASVFQNSPALEQPRRRRRHPPRWWMSILSTVEKYLSNTFADTYTCPNLRATSFGVNRVRGCTVSLSKALYYCSVRSRWRLLARITRASGGTGRSITAFTGEGVVTDGAEEVHQMVVETAAHSDADGAATTRACGVTTGGAAGDAVAV